MQKRKEYLKRGRKKRAEMLASSDGTDSRSARWAALLDGTLTVKDLDDEELDKMQIRGKGGTFGGRHAAIPSHIAHQMSNERLRRTRTALEALSTKAIKVYEQVLDGDAFHDLKVADQVRVANAVLDRLMGRAPETVHVVQDDPWSRLLGDAVDDDRGLDDLAGEAGDAPADVVDR